MGTAVLLKQFESILRAPLDWQSRPEPERALTGIPEIDSATGGLPRGALTEIVGPASSGRTSLLLSLLAAATARQEVCALVDAEDAFSPHSAAHAGVQLSRLLWVRCGHSAEHALKAADLLIQGGGFGLVVMDLGDTAPHTARRISLASWVRLRRAVAHTPTILVSLATPPDTAQPAEAVHRPNPRVGGDRVRPPRGSLVRHTFRLPPAAHGGGARPIHRSEEAMFACLHGTGNLTALALEFSPTVEATGPETVTFDVAGLDRLFGLPLDVAVAAAIARRAREVGVKANLALAGNPDAAICAARGFSGVSLIPHGDEGKFLAALPLALLSPAPQLLETLERWGIRRFHEMAALPPLGIAERLGPEGLRLRELARGEGDRKLLPLAEALHFEDEIELDYPVELLEPLAFLLARLIPDRKSTRL